jgi:hypothetical protein
MTDQHTIKVFCKWLRKRESWKAFMRTSVHPTREQIVGHLYDQYFGNPVGYDAFYYQVIILHSPRLFHLTYDDRLELAGRIFDLRLRK